MAARRVTDQVQLHLAPVAVAPALKLLQPRYLEPVQQPLLPWSAPEPEVVPTATVDAAARMTATRLAGAMIEVLRGRRPPFHLVPHVTRPVLEKVREFAEQPRPDLRVASVHVQLPTDDVAEAAVRLTLQEQSRALAMRLERRRGRWRVTVLEIAWGERVVRAGSGSPGLR